MYPDIAPKIDVKSTISDPIQSEKVIGFVGRNTMLGRTAIVMKEIYDERVMVPNGAIDEITDNDGELVVLAGDEVLTMNGEDFEKQYSYHTVEGRGTTETMGYVQRDNSQFKSWDEQKVKIKTEADR